MDVVEGKLFYQGRLQKACVGIEDGRIVSVRKVIRGDEHFDSATPVLLALSTPMFISGTWLTGKENSPQVRSPRCMEG